MFVLRLGNNNAPGHKWVGIQVLASLPQTQAPHTTHDRLTVCAIQPPVTVLSGLTLTVGHHSTDMSWRAVYLSRELGGARGVVRDPP